MNETVNVLESVTGDSSRQNAMRLRYISKACTSTGEPRVQMRTSQAKEKREMNAAGSSNCG